MDITEAKPVAQLTKTTFIGKMDAIKWHCRAPLKNGKLCPRMDRYKCPFHGKIVARNQMGEIENEKDKQDPTVYKIPEPTEQLAPWQDPDLIADINAATGQNIQVIDPNKKNKRGLNKKRTANLTNLSKEIETPRQRIAKRLFTSKNLSKVGSILDSIERRLHHEKFHHNFNYSLNS
jgi:UV-stimulated scaffold protein A